MNPRNKVWITVAAFVLVMITIACACPSLSNLGGTAAEPMPGLAGKWYDDAEVTTHTIVWDGTNYSVSAVTDDGQNLTISSQNWDGSAFTWVYISPYDVSVTMKAVSVSGTALTVDWTSTNGNSGTDTIYRP
jgi:hypothetical protein